MNSLNYIRLFMIKKSIIKINYPFFFWIPEIPGGVSLDGSVVSLSDSSVVSLFDSVVSLVGSSVVFLAGSVVSLAGSVVFVFLVDFGGFVSIVWCPSSIDAIIKNLKKIN